MPVEDIPYDIVVIDEISMVPPTMIDALFSYNVYVIGLGDPFQLPPIKDKDDNHLLDNPHVFLDQIMRQDEASEIIKLSLALREGTPLPTPPYAGTEVAIINKEQLNQQVLLWADQIITATNATRMEVNKTMRKIKGFGPEPEEGDKVICLTNYWEEFSIEDNNPLVNGTIGYLRHPYDYQYSIPRYLKIGRTSIPGLFGDIETEMGDLYAGVFMDKQQYEKNEPLLPWNQKYPLLKSYKYQHTIPKDFTYGYAITCHKAQGSEWDKILIFEEAFPYGDLEHRRWLYTAITRAAKQVIIVRG